MQSTNRYIIFFQCGVSYNSFGRKQSVLSDGYRKIEVYQKTRLLAHVFLLFRYRMVLGYVKVCIL